MLRKQILLREARSEIVGNTTRLTKVVHVKEGDYVCYQGAIESPLIFLVEGQLRVSTYSEDGVELPLYVVDPHECTGEISILNSAPTFGNVIATKGSIVGLLDRAHARRLLSDPDVARALNNLIASRAKTLLVARSSRSQPRADARVTAVIEAAINQSQAFDSPLVELPSQVSRETVSRVITSLDKRGIVEREGKAIRIRDRVALHRLATGRTPS
ncbi:Crp/Fnr family transcriptional regulator [Paraburkholderia youngii]|uniref:Crp/Fnr family transcriptional regulator n=1 Tax=Paraburkholderia youngii TaxID=2782701 RepID=UPI0015921C71|nr:Crp/Fnr family transcriptional regulator [Paraburkholderia youngii]NUX52747.1 Crp/Fnr family transcriptional regulator [Paraburkholderia youngii]